MHVYHSKMITCSNFVDVHNLNNSVCRVLYYVLWSLHAGMLENAILCMYMYVYMVELVQMAIEELLMIDSACT